MKGGVLALAVLGGVFFWQQKRIGDERAARQKAELDTGIVSSDVLTAVLNEAAEVRVARLTGEVRSPGECKSGNFIPNRQTTIAPYEVSYSIDLQKVDRSAYRWNGRDRIMYVEVPDVTVERPNVDMSKARSRQSGVFVSRTCGMAMQQQVAGRLGGAARKKAHDPDYLDRARGMARKTIAGLVRSPLQAAGLGRIDVRVRLASDPKPRNETWDVSRSIPDVLADPAYR